MFECLIFEPDHSMIADHQGRVHGLLQRDQRQHRPRLILRPDGADCLETVTGQRGEMVKNYVRDCAQSMFFSWLSMRMMCALAAVSVGPVCRYDDRQPIYILMCCPVWRALAEECCYCRNPALELETKVHSKVCNHGEGLLLVESSYYWRIYWDTMVNGC